MTEPFGVIRPEESASMEDAEMLSISWLAESDARGSPQVQTAPRMAVILSTQTDRELQVRIIPIPILITIPIFITNPTFRLKYL